MATSARPVVVGVFTDHYEAQRAIDTLQRAGFAADQIQFVERGGTTTEGNLPGGQKLKDALKDMGVPEENADYYQNEFEVGRTIVVVRTNDRNEQVMGILRENGAYDVNARP